MRLLLLTILLLTTFASDAQVYRCISSNGSVEYSSSRCGNDFARLYLPRGAAVKGVQFSPTFDNT